MARWLRICAVAAFAALTFSSSAAAGPITFRFQGVVTRSTIDGTGRNFQGFFTFDDAAPDARPNDDTTGDYISPNADPYGFVFRSGGFSATYTGAFRHVVGDNHPLPGDPRALCGPTPWLCDLNQWGMPDWIGGEFFFVSFVGLGISPLAYNLGLVTSDDLVREAPDPSLFLCSNGLPASEELPCGRGTWTSYSILEGNSTRSVSGYVTHLTQVRRGVPEPPALMLLAMISSALWTRCRR